MKRFVLDSIIKVSIRVHWFIKISNLKQGKTKSTSTTMHFRTFLFCFSWPTVSSISSNKRRQINLLVKPTNDHLRTLIYYTDSTNYNRYCFRLLQLFSNHFRSVSIAKITRIPSFDLGVSVPDLRSDGETSSNDQTPPSGSSSTRSSSQSAHPWTGSLPNLTVQLSIDSTKKEISRSKNDPYATYADNLNRIDEHETLESTNSKVIFVIEIVISHTATTKHCMKSFNFAIETR